MSWNFISPRISNIVILGFGLWLLGFPNCWFEKSTNGVALTMVGSNFQCCILSKELAIYRKRQSPYA